MKRTLIYGAAALGLLFTSCSADNLVEQDLTTPFDKDQTLYVNMKISGDAVTGSRAAADDGTPGYGGEGDGAWSDFEDGTGQENAVNNVYFVFYDAAGNVVGDIVPIDLSTFHENATLVDNVVEKAYSSVIPITIKKGEVIPAQVICYINPISPPTLQNPLDVIQTISRSAVITNVNGKNYFGMSNSVYYKNTSSSAPQIAVPIDGKIYMTEEEALRELKAGSTVDIYVERYASKLKFTVDPTAKNKYVTGSHVYTVTEDEQGVTSTKMTETPITLEFEPQYWAVNAEAMRSYVIKSFRQMTPTGQIMGDNYSYTDLNQIINLSDPKIAGDPELGTGYLSSADAWNWNNPAYHRSYWGMSPAYYQNKYPVVSADLPSIPDIQQKYISYNELKKGDYGFSATDENANTQYFKETTVGSLAIASENPQAAVPSVIYVGKYKINVNGKPYEDTSFYSYLSGSFTDVDIDGKPVLDDKGEPVKVNHPYIYFDDTTTPGESAVEGGESMLKRFLAQTTILYKKTEGGGPDDYTRLTIQDDLDLMLENFEISEITDALKAAYNGTTAGDAKFQNNTRTLQFKAGVNTENTGIYIVTGNGYDKIVATVPEGTTPDEHVVSLMQANVALMRQVGYSYYYTAGHGYFNIPVKHYGWYRNGNNQKGSTNINWDAVRVGDFGMVRNHSYNVNVSNIIGLAQGIGDDNNPIVPPSNNQDYYMAYSVRILKWAVVPTQNVVL